MKLSTLKCLKLLADPTRLRLILLLQQQALSVVELQEILGMGQSRISTQLLLMKQEGLVTDQRSGKNNMYQSELPAEFVSIARDAAAELPETAKDLAALRHLDRKRKDKARAYFDQLAGKFGKHYVPGRSWKGLAEALLKVMNYDVVADLGAGEGTLSQLLAQRAKHVIAVDISPKMVEFGTNLAKEHLLPNLEFRLGDIEEVPIDNATVDLAILSQALHHAEQPQRALAEAYRILKPGGCLLILDLALHTFTRAHELYSDRWLGFPEGELAEWLEAAGFQQVETAIVDRETKPPKFQTLVATARKA
jgi:ArsR family transcriptional regulator